MSSPRRTDRTDPFEILSALVAEAEAAGQQKQEIAAAIGCKPAQLSQWLARKVRPGALWRDAIEIWSGGRLPSVTWRRAKELKVIAKVRPLQPASGRAA